MLKYLLLFFALYIVNCCAAQNDSIEIWKNQFANSTSDSLKIDAAIDLHNAYFKNETDKSYYYGQQILILGKKIKSNKDISRGYRAIARCIRKKHDYKTIFYYDSLALKYAILYKDLDLINSQQILMAHDYLDAENMDKAFMWLKIAKPVVDKLNKPAVYAEWNKSMAYYYGATNQNKKAIPFYREAIKQFRAANNTYNAAESELFLSQSLQVLGELDSIPALLFDALDIYAKRNSQVRMGLVNELLGDIFCENGNVNAGLVHYLNAKDLYNQSNNYVEEALCLMPLSRAYMQKKDYEDALSTITAAQTLFDTMHYDDAKIKMQTLWGQYYSETGSVVKAESYFFNASRMLDDKSLPNVKAENEKYWSQHEYRIKNFIKADSLMYAYTSFVAKTKEPEVIMKELKMIKERNKNLDSNSIKILSLLYVPGGAEFIKRSLKNEGLYNVLHADSILNLNSFSFGSNTYDSSMTASYNNQLLSLETKYKVREKDDSLQIAHQNAILTNATVKKQSLIIWFVVGFALLLIIAFWLQYNNRQRAVRDKAKIELLQNEIHHRVKNNLGIIKRFAEVAEKSGVKNLPLTSLQNRISAIELLHKNLYQSNEFGIVPLQQYLQQLTDIIETVFHEDSKQIKITVDAPVHTEMRTAEKIGLIVNELVTNSFKYGFQNRNEGIISITIKDSGDKKFVVVDDNGEGYNSNSIQKGYGSKLIEGIANELNASFELQTNNGVLFKMVI